jgi:hypothetical protein
MPIKVNIEKAKEETRHRLRESRKSLLQEQDIAFTRAQETGADTSLIIAEKQRLRDVTNLVDGVSGTNEEILKKLVNLKVV